MKIIILAGGSGTRLWPLSRNRYPKQFIKLQENMPSLFQETFSRSLLLADIDDIYIVTNERYKFLVMGAVEELGYDYREENILIEPESKNTLPAICAGVYGSADNSNESILVFPSDHRVVKVQEFVDAIKSSEELTKDSIITFGIKPDGPNTGYGYISPGSKKLNGFVVEEFKEKPQHDMAVAYVEEGYYWNAGIFMFNRDFFIGEVKEHAKNIYGAFESSSSIFEAFSKIDEKLSIDFGILEKSKNIVVTPLDIGWSDLGSFDALSDILEKDDSNNILNSDNIVIDSQNNYISSEKGKLISTIGISDMIIVDNRDAMLICKKNQSQKVKEVVSELKARNDKRLDYHVQDYRPWGNYKILDEETGSFKIKRINVGRGKKLSYQMHHHRSEHWVVVKGTAGVIIEGVEKTIQAGESVFIKAGQRHRLENIGMTSLEIIEVQIGDYLEEDDIIRFHDE